MKKVVTVHGINTKGEWQKKVEGVLKPHFECVHIHYPHYRHLGATQLIFELRALATGTVISAAFFYYQKTVSGWTVLLLTLIVAHFFARLRRGKVIEYFNVELQKHLLPGERPHLIAHSFGTYLTGKTLLKWNNAKFDSIILTGSVLSKRFRWEQLNRLQVRRVRNERALKDRVSAIAVYGLIPDMGNAGRKGFLGDPQFIHDTKGPNDRCSLCKPKVTALVHNVPHRELGHSDHFLTLGHAESFWLPFFWGIEPCEYQGWLDLCADASYAEDRDGPASPDLRDYETALRVTDWQWCEGLRLEEYLHERVTAHVANLSSHWRPGEVSELEKSAVRLLWKETREAREAHHEWLSELERAGTQASWVEKFAALFQGDAELQNLRIGVQAGYPELAREREDRIRSLDPKRAVYQVLKHLFG